MATTLLLGHIFEISDGRNAWRSTWVTRYYPRHFHLSLEAAKRAVETMRVQGSTWTILELPACIFKGEQHSLILAEVNTNAPLSHHAYDALRKPFLYEIAEAFTPTRPNSILRFVTSDLPSPEPRSTFKAYKSVSYRGGYSLGWRESNSRSWNVAAFQGIQSIHEQSLQEEAFFGIRMTAAPQGVKISRMHALSPLAAHGCKRGDTVTGVVSGDGVERDAPSGIAEAIPGDQITLVISREDKVVQLAHRVRSFAEVFRS